MSARIVLAAREIALGAFVVSAVIGIFEDRKEVRDRATSQIVAPPDPRAGFTIGDLTGKDAIAHLEWMRALAPDRLRWEEAKAWCEASTLEGGRWRLPSRDELMSLLSASRDPFGDRLDWYWSATPGVRPGSAWAVGEGAWINANPVATLSRVRCTRDLR